MYDIRGASLSFVCGNIHVRAWGYGRVLLYTVYHYGVALDTWIMYVAMHDVITYLKVDRRMHKYNVATHVHSI